MLIQSMTAKRSLKLLYIAAFLQAFILWYAIEKLFMQGIGFTDALIIVAVIVMTVTTLIVEVPAGLLADRWSRKGVLILSNIALASGTLMASLSASPPLYILAMVFIGMYSALYSGIYDSIIYDATIEQDGNSRQYRKRYGLFHVLSGVALIAGSIVGSIVSQTLSLQWAYWVTIPFGIASCLVLVFFKEPRLHTQGVPLSFLRHVKHTAARICQPDVRPAALCSMIVGVIIGLLFNYGQLWYIAVALPLLLYGPAYAALQACLVFGGVIADRVRLGTVALAVICTLSTFALMLPNTPLIIVGQIFLQTTLVIVMIWLSGYINDKISSSQRSGIGSIISTATKISLLFASVAFGYLSHHYTVFSTPILILLLVGLMIILLRFITPVPLRK